MARFLPFHRANLLQGRAVGSQPVGDDNFRSTMLSHCFLEEFQCGFLIQGLGHEAFQNLAFVVDRAP